MRSRRLAAQGLGREYLERAPRGRRPREPRRVLERVLGEQRTERVVARARARARRPAALSSSTSRPVVAVDDASLWPAMRVATAGVPHAAASVIVIPQPSWRDALASDPRPAVEVEQRRRRRRGRAARSSRSRRARRSGARARRARSPRRRSPRAARAAAPCTSASASISAVEALDRNQPADRDDERRRLRRVPPGRERRVDPGRHDA